MVAQHARVRVRPARIADADAIADVWVSSWRAAYRNVLPAAFLDGMSRSQTLAYWLARLVTSWPGDHGDWVAERDGRVVGLAQWGPAHGESEGVAELFTLYVAPNVWREGVGSALLEAVAREAVSHGHTELTLWVLRDNVSARRFYRAAGFRTDGGRRSEAMPGVRVPSVRYRKPL